MKKKPDDLKIEKLEPNKGKVYRLPEIVAILMEDGFVVESVSDDKTRFVLKKGKAH